MRALHRAHPHARRAAISTSEWVLPKAGIDKTPGGVDRIVPEMMMRQNPDCSHTSMVYTQFGQRG
jgi:hypothetical protein